MIWCCMQIRLYVLNMRSVFMLGSCQIALRQIVVSFLLDVGEKKTNIQSTILKM